MKIRSSFLFNVFLIVGLLFAALPAGAPKTALAQEGSLAVTPVVAVHVSERTQALESMPAGANTPKPPSTPDTSGFEWWYTAWHYFVMPESLQEALRADGTSYALVSDADINAGHLLNLDGTPRYPILISLAAEAIGDDQIMPLREYVDAGGFLFVGSSSFTRNLDGTTRGNFALASEMGLQMGSARLENMYINSIFTKVINHRLISHIPSGTLNWYLPLEAEEIPLGTTAGHVVHQQHYAWQVTSTGAEVLASGSSGPLLATKAYGNGRFIYYGILQPLVGVGGNDSGMYSYMIFRNAIEWAFEAANLPVVRLSPWRYEYDSAFIARHDFENDTVDILAIEALAQAEQAIGVTGEYYFCTGVLRLGSPDTRLSNAQKQAAIESLQRAVSQHGAILGSHNGGLANPVNPSLSPAVYDYWHWGPDEALDTNPPGYADGQAYALASVDQSFQDIEGWLDGLDNGRAGCGAAGDCPRVWVSPYFNSGRDGSFEVLEQLGAITMGEQDLGPFPHATLSTQVNGKRFPHVSIPVSEWYVGSQTAQSLERHTDTTMRAGVDFYYNQGFLVNFYTHGDLLDYASYALTKPRMWSTNSVALYDWWILRSPVAVSPTFSLNGNTASVTATVSGASDPETALELVIPRWNSGLVSNLQVFFDGLSANPASYRTTAYGVKLKVGSTVTNVEVRYETTLETGFPSTNVLDDFNRPNGPIGSNWSGNPSGYAILSDHLDVGSSEDIYWNVTSFGADQEAFVTLSAIDHTATETGLILKAQSSSGLGTGLLYVAYDLAGDTVQVWTYTGSTNAWTKKGVSIPVTFGNGDQFGARARANGEVEVYRNGNLVGVWNVSDWPLFDSGGSIGLVNVAASDMVMDDFGGGTMGSAPPPVACTDPTSCDPVSSVPAFWRCDTPGCNYSDWIGSVITWPSWSAYPNNARTGANSRTVYSSTGELLYPYMGSWADGCHVTAVSGAVLIIEWQRGQDIWRETLLGPGQSHTIDLVGSEDGAMIEGQNFVVSLENCTPQNIYGGTVDTLAAHFSAGGPGECVIDSSIGDGALRLDASSTSCVFESRILDAGESVNWEVLNVTGTIPVGTSVSFETRTGNIPIQDSTWLGWEAVSGSIASLDGRYVQYRATLTAPSAGQTPVVEQVELTYTTKDHAVLNAPAGTLNSWDNKFKWTGVASATHYVVEVYDAGNTLILRKWYTTSTAGCDTDLECEVSPITLGNGEYTWRVAYMDAGRYGPWTGFTSFTLSAACYELTVNIDPPGTGTVATTAPVCGVKGYPAGAVVTLTASPVNRFMGWSGDASGTSSTTTVTMNGNKSVTGSFHGPAVAVSPSGAQTVWNNQFSWTGVSVAAAYELEVYDSGNVRILNQWFGAATNCTGLSCMASPSGTANLANSSYTWRVRDYNANGYGAWTSQTSFSINQPCYQLATNVSPAGSGVVNTPAQNCTGGYKPGTVVTLTASPVNRFIGWSGDGSGTSSTTTVTMNGNKSVTGSFHGPAVAVSPSGAQTVWNNQFSWTGVSVAAAYELEVYNAGNVRILNQWFGAATNCTGLSCMASPSGTANLANGSYTWRVRDYNANGYGAWTSQTSFSINQPCYQLATNVSPVDSGTVSTSAQNCTGGYKPGTVVTLTASPVNRFIGWSGDGSGTSSTTTVTMNGNKSVTGSFHGPAVAVSPSGEQTTWNNQFSWTGVSVAAAYELEVYNVGNVRILNQWFSAATNCTGTSCTASPSATKVLTDGSYTWRVRDYNSNGYGAWTPLVNFSVPCFVLTKDVNPAGSGVVNTPAQNCTGGYKPGTVVTLTASPVNRFIGWSGDASGTSSTTTVTMNGNKSVTGSFHGPAVAVSPSGEQTTWNNQFSWTGVSVAAAYELEVYNAGNVRILNQWFSAATNCTGLNCVASPSGTANLVDGSYTWRVRDYNSSGYGAWTEYKTFTINFSIPP